MGIARSTTLRVALVASATLLIGGLSPGGAAPAGRSGTQVVLRLSQDEKTNTIPISGTYTASGALRDSGTIAGTHFAVVEKVHGKSTLVAVDSEETAKGARGSLVLKCRTGHFVYSKDGSHIVRGTGRCVTGSPTGIYTRLQPVGSVTVLPTHPRKGYTHTVWIVTVKIRGS